MRFILPFLACVCLVVVARNVDAATYKSTLIDGVPHVRQRPDFCGEACAEMYLAKLGKQMDQDFVFDQSGLDPVEGRGCYTRELIVGLQRIGFQTGRTWYSVRAASSDKEMETLFAGMHADLVAGVPSIICMHYSDDPQTTEHFRLILGYDAESDEVIYHEPAEQRGGYKRMKREMLIKLWPLKYDRDTWTVIRMRLKPGRLVDGESSKEFTDADYAQHIMRLKRILGRLDETRKKQAEERKVETERWQAELARAREAGEEPEGEKPDFSGHLPAANFHVVLQKPFVVVGDELAQTVESRATGTVQWAVDLIKKDYFTKNPNDIITIWLFRDKTSYYNHAKDLFYRRPTTPFGYYSPRYKALVMNISTGGGTLVHEIVHPFMAANFSECPSWFNEGLASLYEQCQKRNGHIWGNVNWRLRGLHEAIREEKVPSFEDLCSTTTREFYDEDPGTNYSQARYLCHYLQGKGLLVKYFHEFHRNVKDDPTGYKTLQRILGEEDMDAFKKKWEEHVMTLRY